jgi:hypothetical protein
VSPRSAFRFLWLVLLLQALTGCMLPQPDTPPVPLLLRPGAPAAPLPAESLTAPVAESAKAIEPDAAEIPVPLGLGADAVGAHSTRASAPAASGTQDEASPPLPLETNTPQDADGETN